MPDHYAKCKQIVDIFACPKCFSEKLRADILK